MVSILVLGQKNAWHLHINTIREDNDDPNFVETFEKALNDDKGKNVIVLTDLPGGSVNQICNAKVQEHKFHLISGVNFPLALELIFQDEILDEDKLRLIVEESRQQIVYMNDLKDEQQETDDEEL